METFTPLKPDVLNDDVNSLFKKDHYLWVGSQNFLSSKGISKLDVNTLDKIHYIFAEKGIEPKVYQVVQSKESYTIKHYRNDRGSISEEADRQARERRMDSYQVNYVQQSWFT